MDDLRILSSTFILKVKLSALVWCVPQIEYMLWRWTAQIVGVKALVLPPRLGVHKVFLLA